MSLFLQSYTAGENLTFGSRYFFAGVYGTHVE